MIGDVSLFVGADSIEDLFEDCEVEQMIRDKDVHVMTKKKFNEKLIMCYDFPNRFMSEGDIEWLVMFGDLFFRNRAKGECWRLCVTVDSSDIDGLKE